MFRKVPLVHVASFGATLLLLLVSCSEIQGPKEQQEVSVPLFSLPAGTYNSPQTIGLSCVTAGAQIFYTTNGQTPTAATGTLYASPIVLTSTATIKAVAMRTGWTSSLIVSRTFTITILQPVAVPTISPDGGTFSSPQTITLSTVTDGASLRYTLNGLEPGEFSNPYFGPFQLYGSATIKAIAIKSGMANSPVVSRDFVIDIPQPVDDPTISPDGGTFNSATSVSLASTTNGAEIYYTVDNTPPSSTHGTLYEGPFLVSNTATVKVIAIKDGMLDSQIVSRDFTINLGSGGISVTIQ